MMGLIAENNFGTGLPGRYAGSDFAPPQICLPGFLLGLKDVAVAEGVVCGDPLLGAEDLLVGDAIRLVYGAQFCDVSCEDIAGQRLRVMFDRVDIGSRLLEFTCAKSLMLMSEFGVVAKARVLEVDSKGEDRTYLLFDEKIRPGAQHVILAEIGR